MTPNFIKFQSFARRKKPQIINCISIERTRPNEADTKNNRKKNEEEKIENNYAPTKPRLSSNRICIDIRRRTYSLLLYAISIRPLCLAYWQPQWMAVVRLSVCLSVHCPFTDDEDNPESNANIEPKKKSEYVVSSLRCSRFCSFVRMHRKYNVNNKQQLLYLAYTLGCTKLS